MSNAVGASIDRLVRLFAEAGYNTEQSIINAEIAAYCEGIDKVYSYINKHFINILFEPGSGYDMKEYIELLGGYLSKSGYEFRNIFYSRMNGSWGLINLTDFSNALKNINRDLKYTISDGEVSFSGATVANYPSFGMFAKGYLPVGARWNLGNNPSNFNAWDNFHKNWNVLDSFHFSFDVIDKLGV